MSEKNPIDQEQYQILATRRQVFDTMLWQTPVLSLTAQAFLFTIILGEGTCPSYRIISAILSLITALGSIQLFAKHRYNEEEDMKLLEDFEISKKDNGYKVIHRHRKGPEKGCLSRFVRWPSYYVWLFTLSAFAIAAFVVLLTTIWQKLF